MLGDSSQLLKALHEVLEDETFQFNSRVAKEAREAAVLLLDWIRKAENQPVVTKFLQQMQSRFEESLQFLNPSSINRDRLWQKFFILRSSKQFAATWKGFLSAAQVTPTPTLYQQLTTLMFREQINKKVTTARESSEDTIHPLTDNERNALRYTAGYICRHLRKQLERSNHALKEELVLCLMDLTTQKDPDASNTDEEWTLQVDRGGLWYVKNTTNLLFVAIEEEIRKYLKCLKTGSCHKLTIIKNVVASEEVEFYWIIAQADFDVGDEDTYQILLHKIVELYLTVRGYSYCSNLIEKYKQSTSKGTKRAKAFRRELHDDDM